ncbi:unnamed protein product [Coccothraustes coccothraustes]
MGMFWIPHLAILMLLLQTMSASDPTEVIGVLGGSVTFRSHNTDGKTALWNFGDDPIVAVKFEDPSQPLFFEEKFKTRFAVSKNSHMLTISPLRMEDAGTYSVKIDRKTSTFTLRVFRELAEPTVTCETLNCSDDSCSSSLLCSAQGDGVGNVSYTWWVRGQTLDVSSVVLLVNETSPDELEPLTCTARNPVSSRNVTVTSPGELCAGAHSSSQVEVRRGFWVLAGSLLMLSLVAFLMFLWKSRGWTKFRLSKSNPLDTGATNDYTTVYAEVGPTQQRVPEATKAKPAAGGPATTIYSLVKSPDQVGGGTAENATTAGLELV